MSKLRYRNLFESLLFWTYCRGKSDGWIRCLKSCFLENVEKWINFVKILFWKKIPIISIILAQNRWKNSLFVEKMILIENKTLILTERPTWLRYVGNFIYHRVCLVASVGLEGTNVSTIKIFDYINHLIFNYKKRYTFSFLLQRVFWRFKRILISKPIIDFWWFQ